MTHSRWIAIFAACALASALTLQSSAQQGPLPAPAGVIQINVNLVQVDAVVTDSKGNPVTDLKAEDFEVLQDGIPQKITNLEFISVKNTAPSPAARVTVLPRSGTVLVPPPPQTKVLKREEIRRTIALVIDDLGLSFDSIVRVRESLKKWVDNEMQPGDLAAVIRTSAGMGSLQRFTMDKKGLHAAIDLVQFHYGRVGTSSFRSLAGASPTDGLLDTSAVEDELEHTYLVGSLGAIQYVVRGLRDLPGRKSLILFSESMRFTYQQAGGSLPTAAETQATGEERMRRLADEANRSSVVIYAVDPRGSVYTGLTSEDNGATTLPLDTAFRDAGEEVAAAQYRLANEAAAAAGLEAEVTPPLPETVSRIVQTMGNRNLELIESRDGMVELTHRTGGLFVRHSNDIGSMLQQAVDDGDGYYLIGYQPEGSTFDDSEGKPKFHDISVRVNRPGLKVRSRAGFLGKPDNPSLPEEEMRRRQIANALVSPFTSGDVHVRLTGLYFPTGAEGTDIKALLHFDANDLTFAQEPDGARTTEIDVVTVTFNADGEQVDFSGETAKIRVTPERYPDILRTGLVYSTQVPVKKPGGYELRVVLRDKASLRLGSAMQFVDVPDVRNGRLTMSGIVIAAQQSPSTDSTNPSGAPADAQLTDGTPAMRVFKAGSTIAYSYQILNARTDGEKKPQLESQIRVFRNGQAVFEGRQLELMTQGQLSNPKRLAVNSTLQLLTLPPGNYVLQIVVADNNRYDKHRLAAQAIDFEVRQ